jgi:hypothetical protein
VSTIEVVRASGPAEFEEWDRAVSSAGGDLLLSRSVWAETLSVGLGVPWSLRLCRLGAELAGGALLLGGEGAVAPRVPYPFFSFHVFFRPELSPTKRIPQGVEILSAIVAEVAGTRGIAFGETPPSLVDLRALSWAGWRVEPRYAFRLALPASIAPAPLGGVPDPEGPADPVARLAAERGIGEAIDVRLRSGAAVRVLLLRDEKRLYALLPSPPPGGGPRGAAMEAARALAVLPVAEGKEEILLVGDAWEEWFGCDPIDFLSLVPVARVRPPEAPR